MLVEVLLGVTLLALFFSAAITTMLHGRQTVANSGDYIQATTLSERALSGLISIRNTNFGALTAAADGESHGVDIDSATGKWAFGGSSVSSGNYVTRVWLDEYETGWIRASIKTNWVHGIVGSGSIALEQDLTDWRTNYHIGNWNAPVPKDTYDAPAGIIFTNMLIHGEYAYVTSSNGAGLYAFNISNPDSISYDSSLFSLGVGAYDLAIRGKTLYVLTNDGTGEIRAYDISQSPSLNGATVRGTPYDLPGDALGRSLAIHRKRMYAGAISDGTTTLNEFYLFDISSPDTITYLDSLNEDGDIHSIAIRGTGAYLATGNTSAELRIVNIQHPASLTLAILPGCDVLGEQEAYSVALLRDDVLIGRAGSTLTDEFYMFDTSPAGTACGGGEGPWHRSIFEATVKDIAVDPVGCYAFMATNQSARELFIADLFDIGTLPQVAVYNATAQGKATSYDIVTDTLYFLTENALLIFTANGTSSCPALTQ